MRVSRGKDEHIRRRESHLVRLHLQVMKNILYTIAGKRNARRCGAVLAVLVALAACFAMSTALAGDDLPSTPWQKRWVYLPGNLYVDANIPELDAILQRARRADYNGVLFEDYKTLTWWDLDQASRWQANARRLRQTASALKLELVVGVFPFGRANALLSHDANLASGVPVVDAPCVVRGGRVLPRQTAILRNGSFEEFKGQKALLYSFQDDPGAGSWIDDQVVKAGQVSLRFDHLGTTKRHAPRPTNSGGLPGKGGRNPWERSQVRVRSSRRTRRSH